MTGTFLAILLISQCDYGDIIICDPWSDGGGYRWVPQSYVVAGAITSGGLVRWDQLLDTEDATSYVSDTTTELMVLDWQAAYSSGALLRIKQSTGNPTGGTLVQIDSADADVTPFAVYGTGSSNGVTVSAAGLLSKAGTGSVRADDVVCTTCVNLATEVTGTLGDANVDGSLEADEVVLAGDVDGAANANDLDEAAVESELEGVLDLDALQGQISDAQIADGAVDGGTGGEIADNSVTAADLGTPLTFADADLIDASAINDSSATEGIRLPQAAGAGSNTAEGAIHWDSTADKLYMGNGAAAVQVDGQPSTQTITANATALGTCGANCVGGGFVFPGSSAYHGSITYTAKANVYASAPLTTCSFKLRDETNAADLCTSGTTTSTTATTILDCGTLSSVPSAAAAISFNLIVSGVGGCTSVYGAFLLIE